MAMTILAGSRSKMNAIFNDSAVNLVVFSWCYNIPLKLLRQELMTQFNGFVSAIVMGF